MSDSKHVSHFQQGHQRKSESVIAWSPASLRGNRTSGLARGVLIVTNERAVFCRKAWFGGEFVESLELRGVTSVERAASMGTHSVVIRSSSNVLDCTLNWASKDQARGVLDALDARGQSQATAS